MGNEEISFSFNFFTYIKSFIAITTGVLVVAVFKQVPPEAWWITIGIIDGYCVALLIFRRLPIKIIIDKKLNILTIESLRYLFRREKKKYSIKEVAYSYKDEGRAVGVIVKTLRIRDAQGKSILELIPNRSGWSEDELKKIFEALQPQ